MDLLYVRIIETLITILVLAAIRRFVSNIIRKRLQAADFGDNRAKLTINMFNVIYLALLVIILAGIWGLHGDQVIHFIGAALTVVGIGFFAQWSLLSNITSGLILFFNHPLKIGDYLSIVDKDFPLEGRVENITLFFIYIRDKEDRVFSISNTVMIQKTFRVLDHQDVANFLEEREKVLSRPKDTEETNTPDNQSSS